MMPSFSLIDQTGRIVTSESLRGRALVRQFCLHRVSGKRAANHHPTRAGAGSGQERRDKLDAHVRFVSITLDPATDTPQVLRHYADAYGIDLATWHFLNGSRSGGGGPREARTSASSATEAPTYRHGSLVVLVDAHGRVMERRADLELEPRSAARLAAKAPRLEEPGSYTSGRHASGRPHSHPWRGHAVGAAARPSTSAGPWRGSPTEAGYDAVWVGDSIVAKPRLEPLSRPWPTWPASRPA